MGLPRTSTLTPCFFRTTSSQKDGGYDDWHSMGCCKCMYSIWRDSWRAVVHGPLALSHPPARSSVANDIHHPPRRCASLRLSGPTVWTSSRSRSPSSLVLAAKGRSGMVSETASHHGDQEWSRIYRQCHQRLPCAHLIYDEDLLMICVSGSSGPPRRSSLVRFVPLACHCVVV